MSFHATDFVVYASVRSLIVVACMELEKKLPSIEDQGQTGRVTTPTRAGLATAAGLDRATPHASLR